MGRFTLRDEGKTIAVGKILKYKPVKVATTFIPATQSTNTQGQANEENKQGSVNTSTSGSQTTEKRQDLVFDLDSGETVT
jgi:hypothetical protein